MLMNRHNGVSERNARARSGRSRSSCRRGTVLIMVVAMLSMLFIVGSVFLSSVTFESNTIERTMSARRRSSVVDQLSREVRGELKRGFLGNDGRAWNSDATSNIGNDTYGEVAGVHPLIASIEPFKTNFPTGDTYVFYQVSDLELTLADTTLANAIAPDPAVLPPPVSAVGLTDVDVQLGENHPSGLVTSAGFNRTDSGDTFEEFEGGTILQADPGEGIKLQVYRRDADGDGVWDSYQYRLPDRYTRSVRGDLAEELRQKDFDPGQLANEEGLSFQPANVDPQAIFYAIRVIPHGAMANVSSSHKTILESLIGQDEASQVLDQAFTAGYYTPEGEEHWLRRRFLLPPRDVVLSALQDPRTGDEGGIIPEALYQRFKVGPDPLDNRWSMIDTVTSGAELDEIEQTWLRWMDTFHTSNQADSIYDVRHLVTTVSHDDQLMRIGRDGPGDWIDSDVLTNAANFAIDEWPATDDNVVNSKPELAKPTTARQKVSLPGLVERILIPAGRPWFDNGFGTHEAIPVDAIAERRFPVRVRKQFIETIQDAFMLMLRNVEDIDGDLAPNTPLDKAERERTAAALTANLIDYVDSDEIPTAVAIRNELDGTATGEFVYGLERQAFISEVAAITGTGQVDAFAVEIHNPYPDPPYSSPLPVVGAYKLIINGTEEFNVSTKPSSGNPTAVGHDPDGQFGATIDDDIGDTFVLAREDEIELVWRVTLPGDVVATDIVIDEFIVPSDFPDASNAGNKSMQRDTDNAGGWRVSVPEYEEISGSNTLSELNTGVNLTGVVRPVELQFSNAGVMSGFSDDTMKTGAFPTTGSLLLLCRYANQEHNPSDVTAAAPFTASLVAKLGEIDNGRMPVFDQSQLAQISGGLSLAVPWGQLVFDYFTALPLNHSYDPNIADHLPTVDQGGLRVHGRIDLNSAPVRVLEGVPLVPMHLIPEGYRNKICSAVNGFDCNLDSVSPPDNGFAQPIGVELAQSIVAYREARVVGDGNGGASEDYGAGNRHRQGTGFLTVGELANVRAVASSSSSNPILFNFDVGNIDSAAPDNQDYVTAVSLLVSLGDWVTTRSHVFTVSGTLRGTGEKSAVDQRALRFQETFDRLPSLQNNLLPRRIGPRVMGPYAQPGLN